jgi:putative membrane protein
VRPVWALLAALVLAQIGYPLVGGPVRAGFVVVTVIVGYATSLAHCLLTRGWRAALRLVAVTTVGGFVVEAVGVATGFPFGSYAYGGDLGPRLLGVPLVIPLAWTWMAWPAWLVAGRLTTRFRIPVAAWALASWDLFLDPQMVAEGYWVWQGDIPLSNYLGWFGVSLVLMALLSPLKASGDDRPMYALYLWTWLSGVLAHAVFLGLPRSAVAGGIGMGVVAVPLLLRRAPLSPSGRVEGSPPQ